MSKSDDETFLKNYKYTGFAEQKCDDRRVTQLFPKNAQQQRLFEMLISRMFSEQINQWIFETELHKQTQRHLDLMRYAAAELPDVGNRAPELRFFGVVWFRWHAVNDTFSVVPLHYACRIEDFEFAKTYLSKIWDETAHKLPAPPVYRG